MSWPKIEVRGKNYFKNGPETDWYNYQPMIDIKTEDERPETGCYFVNRDY